MTITPVTKYQFQGILYDTPEEAAQARAKAQLTILIERLVDKNANIQQCQVPAHIVEQLFQDQDARRRLVEILNDFDSLSTVITKVT